MKATSASHKTKSISYPHMVTKGSASVKIFRINNASRGVVFEVTWYRIGKRYRQACREEKEALEVAARKAESLDRGQGESLSLGSNELENYHAAKKELSKLPAPLPLLSALEEYVAAKIALGDTPLLTAIQQFTTESKARNLPSVTVSELLKEFLIAKKSDGLSDRYLKDCRNRLGRFASDFQTNISSVKTQHIDAWLRSLSLSSRSRNNFRVLIVTLFNFARGAGYLAKDRATEAEHVATAKAKGGEIEIFSCDEIRRLLESSADDVMAYIALGAFAGIRTAEIARLTWDCVRFEKKVIEIKAGMAKTAQRRLVPIGDNLAAWLRKIAKPKGPVTCLSRPEKTASEVVAASCDPAIKWKRNGLRHSYASYRLSVIQDAGKLALEMGNSPSVIFSNYRELVDDDDAKEWFSIYPKNA